MSSVLGIRATIGMICCCCELEISGTLLTVDRRIMDMSEFDVILGMDMSAGGLPPIRKTVLVWYFRGDKHDIFPHIVYESKCQG